MLLSKTQKFKRKKFNLKIRAILPKDITKNYIKSLNFNKFVRYNINDKITKKIQIKYVKDINKSSNNILIGVFNQNKLVGTCGAQQKSKKKYYIGIFIFEKDFKGLKLSKILIIFLSYFLKKIKSVNYIYASVNKKNFISHNLFKSLGFKENFRVKKRFKSDVVYFIKTNNLIDFKEVIKS